MPGSCPRPSAPGGYSRPTPARTCICAPGGVSFCPPEVDYVARVAASLAAIGVPHRRLSGRELHRVYPVFQLPDETDVVFEPDAGMLAAARSVALEVALARELGGEKTQVIDQCPVRRIDLDAGKPTVVTDKERIEADRLIVTAGAWTRQLFSRFSTLLRPTRQKVLYFRPAEAAAFEPGRFPVFIYKGADGHRRLLRHARVPRHGREGGAARRARDRPQRRGADRSATTTARSSAASSGDLSRPWPRRRSTGPRPASIPSPPTSTFGSTFSPAARM